MLPQALNTERRLAALAALILVLFTSFWIHLESSFEEDRRSALDAAKLRATQLSKVVAQEFETTFHAIAYILREVGIDHLDRLADFDSSARRALGLLPEQAGTYVALYDIHGIEVTSTSKDASADISKTAVFSRLQQLDKTGPDVLVADPRLNPRNGIWEVPFIYAIWHSEHVAGYLLAAVPVSVFERKLRGIGLGPHDLAGFARLPSGRILISTSGMDGTAPGGTAAVQARLGQPAGADGIDELSGNGEDPRILARTAVPDFDATVFVALMESDVLAPVEDNISDDRLYFFVSTALLVACMAIVVMLVWEGEKQRRALARQEELYHSLFEQNHSIKLISDPATGQIIGANQAAADFYGYSREQLLGMNITQINCMKPEEIRTCMAEAMQAKRPSFLFSHRLASGAVRRVEVFSGPVKINGREVLYSIIHDVTDRYDLEERLRASEARYRTVFEAVPAGILVLDAAGDFVTYNDSALRILATSEEGLRERKKPLFHPSGLRISSDERPSWRALSRDLSHQLLYAEGKDGERIWITLNSRRLPPDANGTPQGAVIAFTNVTEIVQQEERLAISQLVFDSTTEGIMVTDASQRIVAVNRAFTEITGYSAVEALGHHPSFLSSGAHDAAFYRALTESLTSKGSWEGEITNRHKNGSLFVERLVINAVVRTGGIVSGYVGLFSDITQRKQKEQQLWHQANFDVLTGLPNRTLFLDRAEQVLTQSARRQQPVGILFVDLDRFKPVNDSFGHAMGDAVLKAVATRILSCIRAEDTVGRIGGDEFVVLLPIVSGSEDAALVARKILAALHEPFIIDGQKISIGACVGVATSSGEACTATELLQRADSAMYEAKEAGRGRMAIAA